MRATKNHMFRHLLLAAGRWVDFACCKLHYAWCGGAPISSVCEADRFEEQFVALDQGVVRFGVFGDAAACRRCVVAVPDGPCVIEHLLPLVRAVRERDPGSLVLVFDMPGFGKSRPSLQFDHAPESVAELLDALLDHVGWAKPCVLHFTCSNGFSALAFAARWPERTAAVVLAQTPSLSEMRAWVPHNVPQAFRVPLFSQLLCFLAFRRLSDTWFKIALPKASTLLDSFRATSQRCFAAGGCFCLSGVVLGLEASADATELLTRKVPASVAVTLVWGRADFSHRHTTPGSALQTAIPHLRVEIWDGVGHFPNLEDVRKMSALLTE